jgi:hypothetical protein
MKIVGNNRAISHIEVGEGKFPLTIIYSPELSLEERLGVFQYVCEEIKNAIKKIKDSKINEVKVEEEIEKSII